MRVRIVSSEKKLPQLHEKQDSKQSGLREKLHLLIEEGRRLRILTQGEPPPLVMTENWRAKVKGFLHDNFNASYDQKWDVHVIVGKPKQGFTGMATGQQIDLWKKLSADVE